MSDNDDEKTFSQDDVTAAATRAAREAERKTRQRVEADLAEQLGCTIDEAKAKLAAAEKADADKKTAADLALEAANTAKAEAAAEKAAAAKERLAAKVERKLVAAGVGQGIEDDPDGKKSAAALARAARMVDLTPDADDDAIAAEIDALRAEIPALFTSTGSGETPPPGVPPAKQKKGAGGKTPAERAKDRFAATQTPLAKSA